MDKLCKPLPRRTEGMKPNERFISYLPKGYTRPKMYVKRLPPGQTSFLAPWNHVYENFNGRLLRYTTLGVIAGLILFKVETALRKFCS